MRSDLPRRIVLLLALFFAWTAWSHAQTQVIVNGLYHGVINVDLESGRINWQMPYADPIPLTNFGSPMAVTSDGRWGLWTGMELTFRPRWLLRDLVTGAFASQLMPVRYDDVIAHPRRLQIFATQSLRGTVLMIDPTGNREVRTCAQPSDAAISLDGALLFVACFPNEIVVLDTSRALVVGRLQLPQLVRNVEVAVDNARVFVLGQVGQTFSLEVYEWTTHRLIARLQVPSTPPCCPWVLDNLIKANADRSEVYASFYFYGGGKEGETWVYSSDDFRVVAVIRRFITALAFTPDGSTVVAIAENPYPQPCSALLIDRQTRASRASFLSARDSCEGTGVAIAAAPLSPVNLNARVDRGTVVLNWQLLAHSPMATTYHLEVSLTPGGTAVATFDVAGDQTTLTVPNAPRGTYYVRVRAQNAVGPSPPSLEQTVVVQ